MKAKFKVLCPILAAFWTISAQAKTVRYELTVTRGTINMSGKKPVNYVLLVNGGIPAPTLEFTEGDEAEIVVKNRVAGEEVSTHWHGILLPNDMDGVPHVTTPHIPSGADYTFKFKIRQHGTYWYHSHSVGQEQRGLYGAIVIHPKKETFHYNREAVVVISDWSDEHADDIQKNLKKDGDYYLYKKGTLRSYAGAIGVGKLGNQLANEWSRMGGMDLSDVGYDAFLINGKRTSQLLDARPGEKIRLRIINAGSSSYFYVALGRTPMQVISADGVDIKPVMAKELLMGMAETYDVLYTVPRSGNFELRATAQDGTGYASTWIGSGEKISAPDRPAPDLYMAMNHTMSMGDMDMSNGEEDDTDSVVDVLTVEDYQSPIKTNFAKKPSREINLVLDGDMSRYTWFINGKTVADERDIPVNEGEVVRMTFENKSMMHHPFHLHGHFFRVLNSSGAYSPLKHTVDVPPHSTRTIEFEANAPGQWMLHCHNLYHMQTGMARVVTYANFTPSPEIMAGHHDDPHSNDPWYWTGKLDAATNHGQAWLSTSNTWNQVEARMEGRRNSANDWDGEADLFYRRWMSKYFNFVAGATELHQNFYAVAGVSYLFPFLIKTNFLINHAGQLRLDLGRRFQWTSWLLTDADVTFRQNESTEFEISLMYAPSWHWAVGAMLTENSIGGGAEFKF